MGKVRAAQKFCRLFAGLLLLASTGCAHHAIRSTYEVPVSCVNRVVMMGCDPSTEPLRCEKVAVTYHGGCEQLRLKN